MAIATAQDLCTAALKKAGVVGVGQTPNGSDISDVFDELNILLDQWQQQRWLIWHLVTTIIPSTGAQSYTVGPGGNFNIARPDRIEDAFFRQVNINPLQPDYPLQILESMEDYNRIKLKTLTAFPQYIFYDAAYPIGSVFPWPIPQASLYSLAITTKEQLSEFANLTSPINLPPSYKQVLLYNLTVLVRTMYNLPVDQAVVMIAKRGLAVIRGGNAQIPRLSMPDALVKQGTYDIYSDRSD